MKRLAFLAGLFCALQYSVANNCRKIQRSDLPGLIAAKCFIGPNKVQWRK